ncbi:MAG: hypothetical protein K2X59_00855 [Sphingomonas sp.]|nr:hypothetical protein [Sphingomonas sp.]
MTVEIALLPNERVQVTYALAKPAQALHFAQELGGYRMQDWHAQRLDFRWITEGTGERVERTDGKNFDRITFQIALRYRSLPKSYAPFSPFSEGSALIQPTFLATAKGLTVPDALIWRIEQLNAGGYANAQAEVGALSALAAPL